MIVVIGASGRIGSVIASELLGAGRKVRVMLRDGAAGAAFQARGAELCIGALEDASALERALEGASALYTLVPEDSSQHAPHSARMRMVNTLASAVRASRVPHVVLLSAAAAVVAERNGPAAELHQAEQMLCEASARLTTLRPCYFQENALSALPAARAEGIFPNFFPSADFALPMVATRDVAACALASLLEPAARNEIIDILGPRYSARDVASALGRALGGSPLCVIDIPAHEHALALRRAGLSDPWAHAVAELYACFASGRIALRGDRTVTGSTPLEQTLARALSTSCESSLPKASHVLEASR